MFRKLFKRKEDAPVRKYSVLAELCGIYDIAPPTEAELEAWAPLAAAKEERSQARAQKLRQIADEMELTSIKAITLEEHIELVWGENPPQGLSVLQLTNPCSIPNFEN